MNSFLFKSLFFIYLFNLIKLGPIDSFIVYSVCDGRSKFNEETGLEIGVRSVFDYDDFIGSQLFIRFFLKEKGLLVSSDIG